MSKQQATIPSIDELPQELDVATFARYLNCHPRTVRRMIQQNVIPAHPVNPAAKRVTWRISRSVLSQMVGLDEEPEYVSRAFPGMTF
jgi:excisionase family DNA binding protein